MKFKNYLLLIFILSIQRMLAQEPFDIVSTKSKTEYLADSIKGSSNSVADKLAENQKMTMFDMAFSGLNFIGKGENKIVPSISLSYLKYRFQFFKRIVETKVKNNRKSEIKKTQVIYYLPFSAFSRFNISYDSSNRVTLMDAMSLSGGPLNFRFMPSKRFVFKTSRTELSLGYILDARLLGYIKNSNSGEKTNGLDMSYYTGLGFKFASLPSDNEFGYEQEGVFSFSGMLVAFGSRGESLNLYTLNGMAVGYEGIFRFNLFQQANRCLDFYLSVNNTFPQYYINGNDNLILRMSVGFKIN